VLDLWRQRNEDAAVVSLRYDGVEDLEHVVCGFPDGR
jgi:hypothetical protein